VSAELYAMVTFVAAWQVVSWGFEEGRGENISQMISDDATSLSE